MATVFTAKLEFQVGKEGTWALLTLPGKPEVAYPSAEAALKEVAAAVEEVERIVRE